MKPHIIHASTPHGWKVRIECPGVEEGGCRVMYENPDGCRCTAADCMCRPGPGVEPDHYGCGEFDWGNNAALGLPSCKVHPLETCGVDDWYEALGMEIVDDGDWPGESPWEALVEWDVNGEHMTLGPWKGHE